MTAEITLATLPTVFDGYRIVHHYELIPEDNGTWTVLALDNSGDVIREGNALEIADAMMEAIA